jgi:hypothetical protein
MTQEQAVNPPVVSMWCDLSSRGMIELFLAYFRKMEVGLSNHQPVCVGTARRSGVGYCKECVTQ